MDSLSIFYIFKWWLYIFLLGVISAPLTFLIFRKFLNFGWGFSKLIGLLSSGYLLFLLSVLKILPFDSFSIYLCLSVTLVINFFIFKKYRKEIIGKVRNHAPAIIIEEVLFGAGLLFWAYVRGHQPAIEGLEKFMDYGFVNSVLKSDFLPPTDMWFAGKAINYYWFGHYLTAFLTRLVNIPPAVSYNLMLATIMGLVLSQSFSFICGFVKVFCGDKLRLPIIAGLISAIILVFAGNFHTPFYTLKEGGDKYWYPDATRFIGYNPDVADKTIHEFPLYSFVVADLHGHLLNLPVVILYISILGSFFIAAKNSLAPSLSLIPLGFLLGISFMTNTWDFANYLLLAGCGFLIFSLSKRKNLIKELFNSAMSGITIIVLALITAAPFIFNFESIAQGVNLTHTHSLLWQLTILWGYPLVLTLVFCAVCIKIKKNMLSTDLFIISVLLASWILIILPELIYVKDIYIASHYRANTMFKLTYQAFVMFYLSSGYIIFRALTTVKNKAGKLIASVYFASILTAIMIYPNFAIKSYYGKLGNFQTLNGEVWLTEKYPELSGAVDWFRKNVKEEAVILEAPGDSYTQYNVISSYTGLPTVSGWFVHEWLWRGDAIYPQERVSDITDIYTSPDINLTLSEIKKYKVKYVIIGANEREKFPNINEEKFEKIGTLKTTIGNTKIYEVN